MALCVFDKQNCDNPECPELGCAKIPRAKRAEAGRYLAVPIAGGGHFVYDRGQEMDARERAAYLAGLQAALAVVSAIPPYRSDIGDLAEERGVNDGRDEAAAAIAEAIQLEKENR